MSKEQMRLIHGKQSGLPDGVSAPEKVYAIPIDAPLPEGWEEFGIYSPVQCPLVVPTKLTFGSLFQFKCALPLGHDGPCGGATAGDAV